LVKTTDPGNEKSTTGWIITYTGRRIEPLNPDPAQIDPLDIAHSLAGQRRFTGHTDPWYNTAQHSVLVSTIVPEEDALWGLLHDAPEAYISDIARPVKRQPEFEPFYKAAEDTLMAAVCERFGLPLQMPESVKKADDMLLRAEQRDLMPNDPSDGPIYKETVEVWSSETSKTKFLQRYSELTGEVYEGKYHGKGMGSKKVWEYVGKIKV
jgi:hypothetical protein